MAAHGGQIVVQSAVWQGTTFTLTFPYLGYLLKAGHFVSSITYREGLMALPRQGQLIDLR